MTSQKSRMVERHAAAGLRVVQFGMGPIGVRSARLAAGKSTIRLVGAVDKDPAKIGRDIGTLDGGKPLGVLVQGDFQDVCARIPPDVVLHTTSSSFAAVYPQLEAMVRAGVSVVSSTEELLFPSLRNRELAERLDRLARRHGVVVLGTGVNPGFVMDTLPLILTAVCYEVKKVTVERRVDAATRRLPLQKKVGAGLTVREFNALKARHAIGHVGLGESLALIAHGLGWPVDRIEERLAPVVATKSVTTRFLTVAKGQVAGIWNRGWVFSGGKIRVSLDLRMYVGAKDPCDRVVLDATPPIETRLVGGVAGDLATAAMLVNLAPRVHEMAKINPGLRLMTEMGLPRKVE